MLGPLHETKTMKCPNCSGTLSEKGNGQLVVDICSQCSGTWFDRTEMEQYVRGATEKERATVPLPDESDFRVYTAKGISTCPRCESKTLQHVAFGMLDSLRCSKCHGVFVTQGQFKRFEIAAGLRTDFSATCIVISYLTLEFM